MGQPHLWDFFQVWTQMDSQDLSPEKMNSPANAMFVDGVEYNHLTRFKLYFDKAEVRPIRLIPDWILAELRR